MRNPKKEEAGEAVLAAIGKRVAEWISSFNDSSEEAPEFSLILSPVVGPETNVFAVPDAFTQVLRGAIAWGEPSDGKVRAHKVHVLQVNVSDGKTSRHSFVVTALPSEVFKGTFSVESYHSFVFAEATTSGYAGSGPQVHQLIHDEIKRAGSQVELGEIDLKMDPLADMFAEYGPVLWARWPDQLFPPRNVWNERRSLRLPET